MMGQIVYLLWKMARSFSTVLLSAHSHFNHRKHLNPVLELHKCCLCICPIECHLNGSHGHTTTNIYLSVKRISLWWCWIVEREKEKRKCRQRLIEKILWKDLKRKMKIVWHHNGASLDVFIPPWAFDISYECAKQTMIGWSMRISNLIRWHLNPVQWTFPSEMQKQPRRFPSLSLAAHSQINHLWIHIN